jgi:hypothetical protein
MFFLSLGILILLFSCTSKEFNQNPFIGFKPKEIKHPIKNDCTIKNLTVDRTSFGNLYLLEYDNKKFLIYRDYGTGLGGICQIIEGDNQ